MHRALLHLVAMLGTFALFGACSSAAKTSDSSDAGGSIGGFDPDEKDSGTRLVKAPCTQDSSFYEVPGDGCDNDNDGTIDNTPTCDAKDAADPAVALARTLGICTDAAKAGYGLVSAKLTRGFGRTQVPDPNQSNRVTKFGDVIKPREGAKIGVLSTGYAQEYNGAPDAKFSGQSWEPQISDGVNGLPAGFPKRADGCDVDDDTKDVIALHLELKAPKNTSGFAFDFDFYTAEWPQYVCTPFNDGFIAYLSAKSFNGGAGDNVSFDSKGNPVSVNNGFFDRCLPGVDLACGTPNKTVSTCPAGVAELGGTGFGITDKFFLPTCGHDVTSPNGGATGWLTSQAKVDAEEQFTVDFIIWDTRDPYLDSTILLDNFRWVVGDVPETPVTMRPPDVK